MEKVREKVLFALQEVQRAVIGKQEVTETVMKAFLAGGHVLVEDIPRLGKTTMAIAFSRASFSSSRSWTTTPSTPASLIPVQVSMLSLIKNIFIIIIYR